MPVKTEPRQPVVYDMMLLADALVALGNFRSVTRRHFRFCERQKNLEQALTKIRCLSQFLSATGRADIIKVTDTEFGGVADKSFLESHFDTISKFVSHLTDQRYKKNPKYPQPKLPTAIAAGKELLRALKNVLDPHKPSLKGDAAHWYGVFESRYEDLIAAKE